MTIVLMDAGTGGCAFVLTLRPGHLPRHRGQFALPGGRLDAGESPQEAALRELEEELGIALASDRILGTLDDYVSGSGYRITPVVVWGDDAGALEPDPGEVAQVFVVPLDGLERAVPASGRPRGPAPSLGLVGTRVFAPTAALLVQFTEVALRGRPTRVSDFGEPLFARR